MNLFENIFTDYKSQLHSCQTELHICQTDLKNSQNENKQLTAELHSFQTENKELKTELNTYKHILQISQDKNVILLNELAAYQDEHRKLTNDLSICKAEMREMRNKIKKDTDYTNIKVGINMPIDIYQNSARSSETDSSSGIQLDVDALLYKITERTQNDAYSTTKHIVKDFLRFQDNEKIFYCVCITKQLGNEVMKTYIFITTYSRMLVHEEQPQYRCHNRLFEYSHWLSTNNIKCISGAITNACNMANGTRDKKDEDYITFVTDLLSGFTKIA
jgi:hypothetical protein